ncbi:hypothetical protein [Paraburkholderia aspalathi]|uniref:Uncharacterized protein n=1 Tax=Paraburkholderia aspalathi TaxID=1324617 RepID=A0A1I7EJ72_9BURK|nr:hypothetical protein [Paraburkholderia aspalathi]SFU23990.1 hypothetical protein SAMN05192563_102460 [Paraburkholderia aspalathi]
MTPLWRGTVRPGYVGPTRVRSFHVTSRRNKNVKDYPYAQQGRLDVRFPPGPSDQTVLYQESVDLAVVRDPAQCIYWSGQLLFEEEFFRF